MALYHDLPIYKDCYRLLLAVTGMASGFSRDYRYTLGQDIRYDALRLVKYVYQANAAKDKLPVLTGLADCLEQLKIELRLAYDLRLLSPSQQGALKPLLTVIGKQVNGWRKHSGAAAPF